MVRLVRKLQQEEVVTAGASKRNPWGLAKPVQSVRESAKARAAFLLFSVTPIPLARLDKSMWPLATTARPATGFLMVPCVLLQKRIEFSEFVRIL